MLQSLSPTSCMVARNWTHTVVMSGFWSFFTSDKVTHSEIRSRAGIPSIEYMLLHRQLRWLVHVIRNSDSPHPHHVLYGQLRQGDWSVGGHKKRFKNHIKSILKKCDIPLSRLEALASYRSTCRNTPAFGMPCFDAEYDRVASLKNSRRHQNVSVVSQIHDSAFQCQHCGINPSHALASSAIIRPTFNVE